MGLESVGPLYWLGHHWPSRSRLSSFTAIKQFSPSKTLCRQNKLKRRLLRKSKLFARKLFILKIVLKFATKRQFFAKLYYVFQISDRNIFTFVLRGHSNNTSHFFRTFLTPSPTMWHFTLKNNWLWTVKWI